MAYSTSSGAVIRIGVDGAEESRRQIENVATSMNRLSDTVSGALKTLTSTIGVGSGLAGIIAMSDEYTKYTSQLRLAAQTNSEYVTSLEAVRRIAHDSQQALSGTGVLYARIANGTRELGISQQRVADVTEVVSLALKVSGATAAESASAQLQLSQAFASGTLRGEEFNAVNEAAPRLMLALADGIGVPVGALKNMASNGLITSQVMADVLPKALAQLREESTQVQTISGAFTVLKNNVLEFTAVQAQSNGTVAVLTRGIDLLANNLSLLMNVVATLSAAKIGSSFADWTRRTYEKVVADRLATATTLALAEATVSETAAALAAATARERETRAAVLAAEGHSMLALTQNALIPAQARAAAAAEAHTAALAAQTAATGAASVSGGILRGAMAMLGGPVGAVITVLGLAATAWSLFGSTSASATKIASENTRQSTVEIVQGLDKQIEKLRERNALAKAGITSTKNESPASVRLGEVVSELSKVAAGEGDYANLNLVARQAILESLGREYGELTKRIEDFNAESNIASSGTRAEQLSKWFGENGTKAQQMAAELEKLKKQFGEIPPEMEKLVRAKYADKGAAAAINKETTAYETLISSIRTKIEENRLELITGIDATESQKVSIKITQELASGKRELSASHQGVARALLAELSAIEQLKKAQSAEKDVLAWIIQSTQSRLASVDALAVEYQMYGKSADARELAMISIRAEADLQRDIIELKKKNGSITEEAIAQMRREMEMRVGVTQSALAQTKTLGYAGQLKTENERFAAESILNERDRAAALLEIDAKLWKQRIELAGEGTEAQRLLQEQYQVWYANQLNKPAVDQWKESVKSYDDIFRKGFADMLNNGKSGWASFTKSLSTTFKTSVADQIYKMFAQPFVMKLVASLLGVTGSAAAGVASAAGGAGSSALGSAAGAMLGVGGITGSLMAGAGWVTGATTLGGSLTAAGSLFATGSMAGSIAGAGMVVGALAPIALGIAAAVAIWKKFDTSGTIHTGGAASASANGVNNIDAGTLGLQRINTTDAANKLTAQLATSIVSILDSTATTFGKAAGYTAATAFADDTSSDGAWGALIISNLNGIVSQWGDASSRWAPKVFADGEAGQKEYLAMLSNSVRAALDGIGLPGWARDMLNSLGDAPSLEDLAKVVDTINSTQSALVLMGQRLKGFAGLTDEAVSAIIKASGGMDKLATNASAFYDTFYTDGEKTAVVTKQVSDALKAVGLQMPSTREEFRALVEQELALGAAGSTAAAVLLANSAAYAQIVPAIEASTSSLEDSKNALATAYAAESDAIKATISSTQDYVNSLIGLRDGLLVGNLSPLTPEQQYAEAARQYEATRSAALSGDETARGNLQNAMNTFLTASRTVNASNDQYRSDFSRVQADLAIAIASGKSQITTAEASLTALNKQVSGLVTVNESVLSVVAAIKQLTTIMGESGKGTAAASASSSITSLYQSLLGRAPDAGGMQFWTSQLGNGISIAAIANAISQSPEYLAIHGSHATGLGYVPFNGYRAELHKGEGVLTASENADYRGGLVAAVRALQTEVAELRKEQAQQTGALIASNIQANSMAADRVAEATVEAASSAAWARKTVAEVV